MTFLPEVCLKPRNNWLDYEDDLDCNPYPDLTDLHKTFIKGVLHFSALTEDKSIKLWE